MSVRVDWKYWNKCYKKLIINIVIVFELWGFLSRFLNQDFFWIKESFFLNKNMKNSEYLKAIKSALWTLNSLWELKTNIIEKKVAIFWMNSIFFRMNRNIFQSLRNIYMEVSQTKNLDKTVKRIMLINC